MIEQIRLDILAIRELKQYLEKGLFDIERFSPDIDIETLSIQVDHIPTATLLKHTLQTQGFMSTSQAVSLVAGDHKIVILRG